MKVTYSIAHAIIQGTFAQLMLLGWKIYEIRSIPEAVGSSAVMFLLIGIFNTLFGLVFRNKGLVLKLVLVSLGTAICVTFLLIIYPELGFTGFEWYILFLILIFAAALAYALLYGTGAKINNEVHSYV